MFRRHRKTIVRFVVYTIRIMKICGAKSNTKELKAFFRLDKHRCI